MRLLVTRSRQDGEETAALLHSMGHEAVVAPLLEIQFLAGPSLGLGGVVAILATSANGVRALAGRTERRDLPVFAVGPQTASAARAAGFGSVESADGDAHDLAGKIPHWIRPESGVLLHASGRQSAGALAEGLAAKGYVVRREILYTVGELPLAPEAVEALRSGRIEAALLFSPRSATLFRNSLARESLSSGALAALCISQATAKALAPLTFRAVRVALRPNQDDLLALIE